MYWDQYNWTVQLDVWSQLDVLRSIQWDVLTSCDCLEWDQYNRTYWCHVIVQNEINTIRRTVTIWRAINTIWQCNLTRQSDEYHDLTFEINIIWQYNRTYWNNMTYGDQYNWTYEINTIWRNDVTRLYSMRSIFFDVMMSRDCIEWDQHNWTRGRTLAAMVRWAFSCCVDTCHAHETKLDIKTAQRILKYDIKTCSVHTCRAHETTKEFQTALPTQKRYF